ncbi:MAG: oxidoreductase [Candidatus Margulisbacteria bacterium GWF2_35_9]|nr:MAG: oxidoreductase [Candidatus Margulisbacteria bacterium GWF2_35_9]
MSKKPKIAMYWASACGGCEVSLANVHEVLLDIDANFELVFCPCLVDGKIKDVEAMDDGELLITFFNGAIRNSENEEMAHLLRKKTKILIAYGACSKDGGIPALANLSSKEELFNTVYINNPSIDNPKGIIPQRVTIVEEGELRIPEFYNKVKSLGQTVDVDYFMPGCPPEPDQLINVVNLVLSGAELPPKGSVIGVGKTTVCEECSRKKSDKKISRIYRTYEIIPDEETCLLEQGIVCMGIATRGGCGGLCPNVNMPCTGCYGPPAGVDDQGAKMIGALGAIIDIAAIKDMPEEDIPDYVDNILKSIPDYAGTFYKFSLATALVNGRVNK